MKAKVNLEEFEIHAFQNLEPQQRKQRGFVKLMKEIDRAVLPALEKYTNAAVLVWLCGRVSIFAGHLAGKKKR